MVVLEKVNDLTTVGGHREELRKFVYLFEKVAGIRTVWTDERALEILAKWNMNQGLDDWGYKYLYKNGAEANRMYERYNLVAFAYTRI